jgi:hypothetical protein
MSVSSRTLGESSLRKGIAPLAAHVPPNYRQPAHRSQAAVPRRLQPDLRAPRAALAGLAQARQPSQERTPGGTGNAPTASRRRRSTPGMARCGSSSHAIARARSSRRSCGSISGFDGFDDKIIAMYARGGQGFAAKLGRERFPVGVDLLALPRCRFEVMSNFRSTMATRSSTGVATTC